MWLWRGRVGNHADVLRATRLLTLLLLATCWITHVINGCLRAAAKATIRANGSLNILALTLAACLLPQPSYPGRFQLGRARADGIEKRNNGRQREPRKFHTVFDF